MSEEKWNAKVDQVAGGAKEIFGKVVGDKEMETEGKVDQLVGKVKEAAVDAVDTVKGAVEGLKNHVDKDEE